MLLGIVVGAAFARTSGLNTILVTMVTSSLALGISTGVSVYEAESLERERRISELEKALFRDLSDTRIERSARSITILAALINFFTPLFSCIVTISPFLLVGVNILVIDFAVWFSILLSLSTLFAAGVYMGKMGKTNPWKKGLRMAFFGLLAFTIGYILHYLI
jgi:predicted membrane protein (TIGR00267 family)